LTLQKANTYQMLVNVFCGIMVVSTLVLFFYKNTA